MRIAKLEDRYAVRRRDLELELRADNARLAEAIEAEHGYGPRVTAEIDRSHAAMGELQKETLAHIFAMRAVLRPVRSEEHTSELQSLMRTSYAVFCLKKQQQHHPSNT